MPLNEWGSGTDTSGERIRSPKFQVTRSRGGFAVKINNVPGVMGAYQQSSVRKATKGPDAAAPAKSDGVVRSKEAVEFLALKDKLNQGSEVRRERIEELRRQIEAGTYRPDAREVAAKMLKARVFDDLA